MTYAVLFCILIFVSLSVTHSAKLTVMNFVVQSLFGKADCDKHVIAEFYLVKPNMTQHESQTTRQLLGSWGFPPSEFLGCAPRSPTTISSAGSINKHIECRYLLIKSFTFLASAGLELFSPQSTVTSKKTLMANGRRSAADEPEGSRAGARRR